MHSSTQAIDLLQQILVTGQFDESLFTDAVLHRMPLPQLRAVLAQMRDKTGPVVDIEAQAQDKFLISTATHRISCKFTINNDSRVNGLWFNHPAKIDVDFNDVTTRLTALPGQVAVLVTHNDKTLFEHNADTKLAVGSAFKLGVLAALAQQIDDGERCWDDIIELQSKHLSLPSGILQKMPVGSPMTLHTVAALMISISDNTATDMLIDLVGREAIQEMLGTAALLSTREFFLLKTNAELRQRFLTVSDSEKAKFLTSLDPETLHSDATIRQHHPGVEWYLSARQLHELMNSVSQLDVMSISNGPAKPEHWQHIAYKGGSEPGVRNRTTAVIDENDLRYGVIVTINCDDDSLDSDGFDELCAELLASLASTNSP
jgi:beta-lactamase class A